VPRIEITGCAEGFEAVSCVRLLQSIAGLSAADAKRTVAAVLAGTAQAVRTRTEPDALMLVKALARLGASARLTSSS
jgi:hypothetical protein